MYKYKKFWNKMAVNFDSEEKKTEKEFNNIVELCRKYLNPNYTVFDLACGTGSLSIELAGYVRKIYAVDYSDKMIEIAEKKTTDKKINNIEYLTTDIFEKQLDGKKADVVFAFNILHLLNNLDNVLTRIRDLLESGGMFISSTVCLGERKSFISILLSFLSKFGIVPYINKFTLINIENNIKRNGFNIIETINTDTNIPNYFIAAQKNLSKMIPVFL